MQYKKLCDIAEITVGQILTRVADDNAEDGDKAVVISPKALNDGFIDKSELKETVLVKKSDADKYTQAGDVMIKLSSPYDAGYIDKENEGYLIPSFLAAVRVKADARMDARYLAALLNSEYTRKQLQTIQTGAKRPMIRVSDLRDVDIPVITMEEMQKIGEEYMLSCEKRKLLTELAAMEKEIMDAVILGSAVEVK